LFSKKNAYFCARLYIYIMKKNLLGTAFALFIATATFAQIGDNSTLLTVGGDVVTRGEFMTIYKKNNSAPTAISVTDYLDLFINFKLKVKEAKDLGLDTAKTFSSELRGYRKQLATPYLTDKEVNDKLLTEAYDRSKKDVRAAHILIKCDAEALPKDTLIAYKKAVSLRDRVLKGEDFNKLAEQFSDDPSAKENKGDLGYFTVFNMVYPFETAAYSTQKGQVSMPVRTRFGYHLVKVEDMRDAQGTIHTAHIMVKLPKDAKQADIDAAKLKIDEVYTKLKAGEKFDDLAAKYSDDKASAKKGGELPWFGTGRMVPEFETAAFKLNTDGEYSEPVLTQYGWHIIKRLEKKGVASFDDVKVEFKSKIGKDSRAEKSKTSLVNKIKAEAAFKEDRKMLLDFNKAIDSTIYDGNWKTDKAAALTKVIFNLGNKNYTQADFAKFIASRQTKRAKDVSIQSIVNTMYDKFVEESALTYEDTQLEGKYPAFRDLLNEYRDGMLLFEITDKKVWSKAVEDTLGLKGYYDANKNNYMWGERADVTIFKFANKEVAERFRKYMKKNAKNNPTNDQILKEMNKTSQLDLQIEEGVYSKKDNETVDKVSWVAGTMSPDMDAEKSIIIVRVNKVLAPSPKSIAEARGLITADYQNYLEKEWIGMLRKKYTVTVDKAVLDTIK
jgi:peptidyl-prolyl cis-trans isomerase SurA